VKMARLTYREILRGSRRRRVEPSYEILLRVEAEI